VMVSSNVAGQTNLFAYAFDEFATDPAVTRQITTTPGNKNSIQFAPDGKSVWFLEQGRIVNVTLENKAVKQVAVRAEVDVDFAREKWDVFHQAWEFLNDNFYDPEFHGHDWATIRKTYLPYAAGSRTPDELRRVLSLMIGELNASHMGISAPPPPGAPTAATGRLGLEFDRGAYEQRNQLRVTAVIPNAAAALSEGVRVGDYVLAIDGAPVAPNVSVDSILAFKVGKRVALRVSADPNLRTTQLSARNRTIRSAISSPFSSCRKWLAPTTVSAGPAPGMREAMCSAAAVEKIGSESEKRTSAGRSQLSSAARTSSIFAALGWSTSVGTSSGNARTPAFDSGVGNGAL